MCATSSTDRIPKSIANRGPMNEFVGPFDVVSKLTDDAYHVRFSHMWNGIATRHSDTVDSKFFVDGHKVIIGLAHTGLVAVAGQMSRAVTDRESSYLAAEYLRERLEQADDRILLDV